MLYHSNVTIVAIRISYFYYELSKTNLLNIERLTASHQLLSSRQAEPCQMGLIYYVSDGGIDQVGGSARTSHLGPGTILLILSNLQVIAVQVQSLNLGE